MQRRRFLAVLALALAGCASTTLRDTWTDPGFRGPAFRKVFVLGVSHSDTDRRLFEDIMVQRIAASGVEAIPAWRYLPEAGPVPQADLERAVTASGADAVLMTRVRNLDRRVSVSQTPVPMGPGWGPWGRSFGGWYSGWHTVTDVRETTTAVVETSLFDARPRELVWTATSETFQPRSVQQDGPGFADVIVRELQARRFLPQK
jgi:hypothetical protein